MSKQQVLHNNEQLAIDWVNENQNELIELSTKIWDFAELGLHEFKSSKLIADYLEKEGFEIEMGVAGMPTAFVATWGSGKSPVVGLLGEYDALPDLSQELSPTRKPIVDGGNGHGCGHNIYGVAAAGGAIAAKKVMEAQSIDGTVKFYGCPAEETLVGKTFMARDGVFDEADICLTWHPMSINTIWEGSSLAMNSVKFTFYGQSAHAAANPEAGRSALKAVQLMDIGTQFLREHLIDEARIHSTITNGGGGPNVVPNKAQIWYYIRAPYRQDVEDIYARLKDIAKGAALMTATDYEIDFITGCYNMLPNRTLGKVLYENMKKVGPPEFDETDRTLAEELTKSFESGMKETALRVSGAPAELAHQTLNDTIIEPYDYGKIMSGSTDVSDVSWIKPTAQFTTACAPIGTPGHSWQNVVASGSGIGQKGMLMAAKIFALSTIDLLKNKEMIEEAKKEWAAEIKAKGEYRSPLPADLQPPIPIEKE